MYWIDVNSIAEQHERDQIDREIDCKAAEAQAALDAGRWCQFLALAGDIALLLDEYDAPFALEIIY